MISETTSVSTIRRPRSRVDEVLLLYESTPWMRAILQVLPMGGSVDTLIAWRGTALKQARFEEFIRSISARVEQLENRPERENLLQSEEFVELFATAAEAAVNAASKEKRERAAAFIAGTIRDAKLHDLSQQIADDLNSLRDLHLRILASLPEDPRYGFLTDARGAASLGLPPEAYAKGLSDLARFGFIRLNTDATGTFDSGPPEWETTEYLGVFRRAIQDDPSSV